MKEKVVNLIDQLVDSSTGKRKKYAKTLRNYVDSRDASFAANTAYALRDCSEIMRPFLKKYYEGEFEETVEEISERIRIIRNGIAHCRPTGRVQPPCGGTSRMQYLETANF